MADKTQVWNQDCLFVMSSNMGLAMLRYGMAGNAFNLENAVQPRMDTDGHGCQALAKNQRLTQQVNETLGPKSVFIRVHPWFMTSLSSFN